MIPELKSIVKKDNKVYFGLLNIIYTDYKNIDKTISLIKNLNGNGIIDVEIKAKKSNITEYSLNISNNAITIEASEKGVYCAISTLSQMIEVDDKGSYVYECEINDKASFEHRGFELDDARHFHGKDTVKEALDLMFNLKLNMFHWHISDDQGFRIALPGYDDLTEKATIRKESHVGGWIKGHMDGTPHGGYYTIADIKEIKEYAKVRGITVFPEIDMPGHFASILSVHPEFTCTGEAFDVPGTYGPSTMDYIICLGNDKARNYAKQLLLDVAKAFDTDLIHIGFDETRTTALDNCPKCQAKMKELGLNNGTELIENFRQEVRDFLLEKGINVICWNDGLTCVDEKVIVQHWKGGTEKDSVERINNGQKMIVSDFFHYYMDYPYAMTPLKKTYNYSPIIKGVEKKENVVGIEAPIWAEYYDDIDKFRFNCCYRLAAISEAAWNNDNRKSYKDFIKELRSKEEKLFGMKLNIKESQLNPILTRIPNLIKWGLDANYEVKAWKKYTK